jgi:hypothetical protein
MTEVHVIAFPDGKYLDKDGQYSDFFFAKLFDTHEQAMEFAAGNIEYGVHFKIDKLYTQAIA